MSRALNIGTSGEGKILDGILEILEQVAEEVDSLESAHKDLKDYVEAIDDDLALIEDIEDEDETNDDIVDLACPTCGSTTGEDDVTFLNNGPDVSDVSRTPRG